MAALGQMSTISLVHNVMATGFLIRCVAAVPTTDYIVISCTL